MSRRSVSGPDFGSLYRGLRVDHLEAGELDYELLLRNIAVADDESRCKRRRRLKQILKEEREGHEFIIHYDLDPEVDMQLCRKIFTELQNALKSNPVGRVNFCKARLLHLGHRLAVIKNHSLGEIKSRSIEDFNRVLELFSEYFWTEDQFFNTEGESGSESEELFDEAIGGIPPITNASDSVFTGTIPKQPELSKFVTKDDFSKAMTDIGSLMKALSNQINGLRDEIRRVPTPAPRTSLNQTNPFLKEDLDPSTRSNHIPTSSGALIDFNVIISSAASKSTGCVSQTCPVPICGRSPTDFLGRRSTALPTSTVSGSIPYPAPVSNTNESFCRKMDNFSFSPLEMGYQHPNLNEHPPLQQGLPVSAPSIAIDGLPTQAAPLIIPPNIQQAMPPVIPPAFHPRKMMPVSQWKVKKYSGTDHGLELNEFLSHVQQIAISERATEVDLFDSAIHLLEGPALSWYTTRRSQQSLRDWAHLMEELKREFRHPDLDSVLRTKIYQTRQQKGESFQQYFLQMSKMFQAMSTPISDPEKVEVLKTNLRYDGRKALVGKRVTTLQDLMFIGKDLDATDFSAFTKVFGAPRKETCAINSNSGNLAPTRTFFNKNRQDDSVVNQNHQKNNKPKLHNPKTENKPSPQINPMDKGTRNEVRPTEQKPSCSKTGFLAKLISEYTPPSEFECYNCGDDHSLESCPVPRRVFCSRCALKGFTTENCPYCIKNWKRKP